MKRIGNGDAADIDPIAGLFAGRRWRSLAGIKAVGRETEAP